MGAASINSMRITAIVPAAGRGTRLGATVPKQFIELEGRPVLVHCLGVLDNVELISAIIVSASQSETEIIRKMIKDFCIKKVTDVVEGGKERTQSVRNAFNRISSADYVLIHDAVRPFITESAVVDVIHAGISYGAAISAVPVTDTVKFADKDNIIVKNIERNGLWLAQTPQVFSYDLLSEAYRMYDRNPVEATDESGIMELQGTKVKIVQGSIFNIKITTESDLILAKLIAGIR